MTHIDLLHFCSVCNSWRSSVLPCIPCVLKIPTYNTLVTDHVYLSKRIIYVIELPRNPDKTAPLEQWFVKGEEDEHGVHHLLHPLTNSKLTTTPFQKLFDSSNLQVHEWSKEYVLQYLLVSANGALNDGESNMVVKDVAFVSMCLGSEDFVLY